MLQASIVIPVWNGAKVISSCLQALYTHRNEMLLEVICVDNASPDSSALLIAEHYPQVRLVRLPVNLGFAGGVNTGIDVAKGDVLIVLNQDCIVQAGWLTQLLHVLATQPAVGIAGCAIFNADGTLNHSGAQISRPEGYGIHLTHTAAASVCHVEYVTGAVFAIRRAVWQVVGRFDEGFYPAYYEDSDYCYRTRHKGIAIVCVTAARVTHLASSNEWQTDPLKSTSNQQLARYRFICKHFSEVEFAEFIAVETKAIAAEIYLAGALGRVLAAHNALQRLSEIVERRWIDCGEQTPPVQQRQWQVGLTQLKRLAFARAIALSQTGIATATPTSSEPAGDEPLDQKLRALQQREYALLARIYFRSPTDVLMVEPLGHKLWRWLILRPLSIVIGREHWLLTELNALHVERMDLLTAATIQSAQQLAQAQTQLAQTQTQLAQTQHRLNILELLMDYENR